jgi:SsrA-binding protein
MHCTLFIVFSWLAKLCFGRYDNPNMAKKSEKDKNSTGPVAVNKKAYHNFEIVDKYEAGMVLKGSEVKSLRDGAVDLSGSYARIIDDQCWLVGASISQYEQAGIYNHQPITNRKILLHKAEIQKIRVKLEQRGFTFVPLKIYFNSRGLAKIELGLAKGKKQYDKRQSLTDKQQKRDLDRDMKKYR